MRVKPKVAHMRRKPYGLEAQKGVPVHGVPRTISRKKRRTMRGEHWLASYFDFLHLHCGLVCDPSARIRDMYH